MKNGPISYSKCDVCAVIVTYNPDIRLSVNCGLLQQQVGAIVIVDNGSNENVEDTISAAGLSGIIVIQNKTNVGLAAALNIGIRYVKNKYRWILTFDQDSIITDSFVSHLIEAYNAYPNNESLAIVAPIFKDQISGTIESYREHKTENGKLYAHATTTMTSGNLISTHVFDKVGLFREDFFIDYIDNEFCLRCRRRGYKIIESTKACLLHSVGNPRQHKLLWGTPVSSNHSPLRRYYSTRNRIVVYKIYFTRYPRWVLKNIYILFKDVIKIFIFEKYSMRKYYWMLRGIRDAMLNRMGQVTEETPNVHAL